MKHIRIISLALLAMSFMQCKKDQLGGSRSTFTRIKTIKEDLNPNAVSYITSTFQYDSLGHCIVQDIDSGNSHVVWSWSPNQVHIDWYQNGSLIPDTSYTIHLNNQGLMNTGNLWGYDESATFDAQQQRTFSYFNWKDGFNFDSTFYFWSNGNIDSLVNKSHQLGFWQSKRYTYYPATINTISPVYWGRTYFGTQNINLRSKEEIFENGNWRTQFTYTYEFDSLNRATMSVARGSSGNMDTTFYTYY
jgi:hypothetical protein